MVRLLNQADWGEDRGRIQRLKGWVYYPLLLEAYDTLQEEALFPSAIHGPAHIHRVLLLSALVCQGEGVGERMVRQVFRAASYHDVGRTFDGYDVDHGARSALRLASFHPQNLPRALELTRLLKDADNLDRVRLGDLDPRFLRHSSAKDLTGFAERLFQRYPGEGSEGRPRGTKGQKI